MKSILLIAVSTALILTSCRLLYVEMNETYRVKVAYDTGYRDARKIYECDHDRTECEMLNENY
jgi:hypothetical protein